MLIPISILFGIYIVYVFVSIKKNKKNNQLMRSKQKEFEERIKILNQNKERQYLDLEKIEEEYNVAMMNIKEETKVYDLENILELIDAKQRELNEQTLNLYTLKIDNNNILPKLENLVNIEEELENLKETQKELEQKRENIKRTLDYLEIAYNKMKEQITPKFTKELSYVMEKISNGKYKNVRINTSGEIIVEDNNGDYITAENLSIGTIDQLYLSLRLATIKEITKEKMPIILDEAFAYYDEERLQNILSYLVNEYIQSQIIIFTCTNRENEILEKLGVKYNKIDL